MPLRYPDIMQHNNADYAIADAEFIRGGGRVVADLTALYALSTKADQLKVRVTRVWVTAEAKYYVLVNLAQANVAAGWTIEVSSGDGHTHANKTTLDKIGESAGNPTWNGGAWPGSGGIAPNADNIDAVLTANGEAAPTGDTYIPLIGKAKAKLSAIATLFGTLLNNTFAAKTHPHAQSEITNLTTDLAGKAATLHNHDSSYVAKNTAITGATKAKITYDSKGLVTAQQTCQEKKLRPIE